MSGTDRGLVSLDTSAFMKLVAEEAESAALRRGQDLAVFVTYDSRMASAARSHGVPVVSPS